MIRPVAWGLSALGLLGCASAPQNGVGVSRDPSLAAEREATEPAEVPVSKLDPRVVERAALPFFGVRVADGERLAPEELLRELSEADVVCVGERHDNPHDHWAQLRVLRGLLARAPMRGREVAVGLEMVQRPYQPALDRYLAWEIDERELLEEVEWHERWGYDWAFYRPVAELGRRARLRLLALNAARELTTRVAREGLDALGEDEQKELPELDLTDADHRAWFDEAMRDHPPPVADRDDMYAAQVLWDEQMAESAAAWLRGHLPLRQLLILAGTGHCRSSAIPERVRRRVRARTASVRPLIELPKSASAELSGFDYGFVMTRDP